MKEWRVYSKKADFESISRRFGIDQVVARIIRNRNVEGMEAIDRYLNGSISDMYDPGLMKDMDKAADILLTCIKEKRKIRIIGDYDIDGICSIYILFKGLLFLGADVDYEVPDRIADGYGINEKLILEAYNAGRDVILTCDNGIAAVSQIEYAKSLGMTVIITDHHDIRYEVIDDEKKYLIPCADAVVNPKQEDCKYPFKNLCGAGVAYKLIQHLNNKSGVDSDNVERYLEFAAIATVGDVVDLQDENRIIVKSGLNKIKNTSNPGLSALIELTGINRNDITSYHIGFVIGPCLNASGRLDTAKRAIKMLLTDNKCEAERLAGDLKSLNDERKTLTLKATESAIEQIEGTMMNDRVLVVFLPDCHESIAGIVAGRIRERYYKPAIVLTRVEDGVKGSARSIESYNIFEKLLECEHLLTKFGGHPLAAGLSLKEADVDTLRKELNDRCGLSEEDLTEKIWIDVPMPLYYISEKVINDMACLEPFGKGNEKPVFADKNISIINIQKIGKNGQFTKMQLEDKCGCLMEAMLFMDCPDLFDAYINKNKISCTYYPEINEFRGNKKLQICVTGYKIEK